MNRIALLALTLSASAAYADDIDLEAVPSRVEPNAYVAAGGIFGEDHFEFHGIGGEVGHRIGHSIVFGRAMASVGNTALANDPGRGTYQEARAGAELRDCRHRGVICASLGLDLGVHRATYEHVDLGPSAQKAAAGATGDPLEERFDSFVVVPRLTIDGGARIRVRGVLELPQHSSDNGGVSGYAVSLALGVGF